MKVKVQTIKDRRWIQDLRETIFWLLFFGFAIAAAFGGGYFYRDWRADQLREDVYRLEYRMREMRGDREGKQIAERRERTGSGKSVTKK